MHEHVQGEQHYVLLPRLPRKRPRHRPYLLLHRGRRPKQSAHVHRVQYDHRRLLLWSYEFLLGRKSAFSLASADVGSIVSAATDQILVVRTVICVPDIVCRRRHGTRNLKGAVISLILSDVMLPQLTSFHLN